MLTLMKLKNKLLVARYPFLRPKNAWTGLEIEDYDYSWTELDDMPDGWRKAFGIKMCEEIRRALLKEQKKNPEGGYHDKDDVVVPYLYGYMITQIKEKYGQLRWYDKGAPKSVYDIIDKYTDLSERTCIICGKPAKWITMGWISPYCDKCISGQGNALPIKEYFNKSDSI